MLHIAFIGCHHNFFTVMVSQFIFFAGCVGCERCRLCANRARSIFWVSAAVLLSWFSVVLLRGSHLSR